MEMSPDQREQLSGYLYLSNAGNVEGRLEEWWQIQRPSSGNSCGGRGHAIVEPTYLTTVMVSLGRALLEGLVRECDLGRDPDVTLLRQRRGWRHSLDGCIAEYAGPLGAVLVQHTGGRDVWC